MTHSKDCLYHLEQSFLDCTCGEERGEDSDAKLIALLGPPDMQRHDYGIRWWTEEHILAAMRRISTPIPLTPSDEMVEAAAMSCAAAFHWDSKGTVSPWDAIPTDGKQKLRNAMRQALQAALNLMGGKK